MIHAFALSLLPLSFSTGLSGGQESESAPRLVVMLAVDQLIPEQLERLGPHLHGGLGRLLRDGTVYREAYLPYARTETGAGHVSYSTGCLPSTHGVVGNSFWNRARGVAEYCVEDGGMVAIRQSGPVEVEPEDARSPRNLKRPTLAELVQASDPATRVVSISSKDRAAIGMAGRARGDVLWWDSGGSGFQSSSWYTDALPAYVREWNDGWIDRHRGWVWEDTSPYPGGDASAIGTAHDDREGERPRGEDGVSFPYTFTTSDEPKTAGGWVFDTPLPDGWVVDLALAALDVHALGQRSSTDLMLLSFSGCDACGHQNGPYSREVTDLLFRLDRRLAALFDRLDEVIGRDGWVATLTADHGVLPLPESLRARGVDAWRVTKDERAAFRGDLVRRLSARLGARVRNKWGPGGLSLDAEDLGRANIDPVVARAAAADIARELRTQHRWVDRAYSFEEIAAFGPEQGGIEALLRHSFDPARTIDVVVVHRPHAIVENAKGTTHGSPHVYDRHVPLILYGPGFTPGVRSDVAASQDVVPTLVRRLGLRTDAAFDGRDLRRSRAGD